MIRRKIKSQSLQNLDAVSIVGAGVVGTTLALLLRKTRFPIVSVISRKTTSARKLAQLVQCKDFSNNVADIHPSTRILLLTVSDSSIAEVASQIAQNSKLNFKSLIVCHTSGSLTSDELRPLQEKGATVFSLHPIQTFPNRMNTNQQLHRMQGIWYGVEGNAKAIRFAKGFVRKMGGNTIIIPKEEKILYHIACVLASNYTIALLGAVEQLLQNTSLQLSLPQLRPLVTASVENAISIGARRALTGPVARGDERLIQKHTAALQRYDKKILKLYQTLGLQALEMAVENKKISTRTAQQIKKLLQKNTNERKK
jgi:predicted short-subunit dehydrogenase-like oxidoreductase (DUF2520 family)